MSGGFDDNGDLDLDAAEYVLGTMGLDERLSFAERIKRETATGLAVTNWEMRLAGLGGRLDAVTPPPQTWERIERAIAGASGGATIPFKVIAGGGRQTSDASVMRRSRDRWRMAAFLSGAVAALLIVALVDRAVRAPSSPDEPGTTYVAAVNRGGDKPALIVRVDTKTREVSVRPVAATTPAGHSLELWYIGEDKTPRSLGVVDKNPLRRVLPSAADNAATFAISLEPPGGSKTGAPTGPVVYSGQLVEE